MLQHIEISRKFIVPLRNSLEEYDNFSQPLQYYEDLAWGGLFGTSTFDILYPAGSIVRDRILATNSAEDNNSQITIGTVTASPQSVP
jgi:hypothetical protein